MGHSLRTQGRAGSKMTTMSYGSLHKSLSISELYLRLQCLAYIVCIIITVSGIKIICSSGYIVKPTCNPSSQEVWGRRVVSFQYPVLKRKEKNIKNIFVSKTSFYSYFHKHCHWVHHAFLRQTAFPLWLAICVINNKFNLQQASICCYCCHHVNPFGGLGKGDVSEAWWENSRIVGERREALIEAEWESVFH